MTVSFLQITKLPLFTFVPSVIFFFFLVFAVTDYLYNLLYALYSFQNGKWYLLSLTCILWASIPWNRWGCIDFILQQMSPCLLVCGEKVFITFLITGDAYLLHQSFSTTLLHSPLACLKCNLQFLIHIDAFKHLLSTSFEMLSLCSYCYLAKYQLST